MSRSTIRMMSRHYNTTVDPWYSHMRDILDILLESAVNPNEELTWVELIFQIQNTKRLELHPLVYASFVADASKSNQPFSTLLRLTPRLMESLRHDEVELSPWCGSTTDMYTCLQAQHVAPLLHDDVYDLYKSSKRPKFLNPTLYSLKITNAIVAFVQIDRFKWIVPEEVSSCTCTCFLYK